MTSLDGNIPQYPKAQVYKIATGKVENLFFVPVDQLTTQQMQEAVI